MNLLWRILQFCKFYANSSTKYNVHSPYVSRLLQALDKKVDITPTIERSRQKLFSDPRLIVAYNLGASVSTGSTTTQKVSSIARTAPSSIRDCHLIRNIVDFHQPIKMLELGTNFGISATYMLLGRHNCSLITLEGNPDISDIARETFSTHNISPDLYVGPFAETLPKTFARGPFDLVFIDGDHQQEPTIRYVKDLIPHLAEDAIMILHDIYWSPGMKEAWHQCKNLPEVTSSLDLFSMGILFFRGAFQHKSNVKLVPYWSKPWKIGLF